jgi:hypothetical protein
MTGEHLNKALVLAVAEKTLAWAVAYSKRTLSDFDVSGMLDSACQKVSASLSNEP